MNRRVLLHDGRLTGWLIGVWLCIVPLLSVGQSVFQQPLRTQWDSLPTRPATFRWVTPAVVIPIGVALAPDYPNSHLDRFYIRGEIQKAIHLRTSVDNYLQYTPMVAWAGLSLAGVQGRSTPLDRAGIALVAHGVTAVVVFGLKNITQEERPDGSNDYSFPSGHTALAFTGAGLLDREFGNVSPLIPIGGYAVATTTGALRIVNDNHWISDVLVGAGIGLLSTEVPTTCTRG